MSLMCPEAYKSVGCVSYENSPSFSNHEHFVLVFALLTNQLDKRDLFTLLRWASVSSSANQGDRR